MYAILLALAVLLAVALPARADPPVPQIQELMDTPPSKFDLLLTRLNMHLLEFTVTTPYRFMGFYSTNPGGEDHIVVDVQPDADQPATRENCIAAINAAKAALDVDPATAESTVTGTTISTIFGSLGAPKVGDAAAYPELVDSIARIQATVIEGQAWIGCNGALFSTEVDFPPPE
jgi:hypothetical protein